MKTFEIYTHKTLGTKVVKTDFSWFAFLLPVVFLAVNKLWKPALAMLVLNIVFVNAYGDFMHALDLYNTYMDPSIPRELQSAARTMMKLTGRPEDHIAWLFITGMVSFIVNGVLGNKASGMIKANLVRNGYVLERTVEAETVNAALAV